MTKIWWNTSLQEQFSSTWIQFHFVCCQLYHCFISFSHCKFGSFVDRWRLFFWVTQLSFILLKKVLSYFSALLMKLSPLTKSYPSSPLKVSTALNQNSWKKVIKKSSKQCTCIEFRKTGWASVRKKLLKHRLKTLSWTKAKHLNRLTKKWRTARYV